MICDKVVDLCVNVDVSRAERSDGCGGSIEAHEMHIDIAVVLEGCGDRQAGDEGPSEAIDKELDQQIALLQSRGMEISDIEKSKEVLLDVGYYRLGFYWFPFEKIT